MSVRDLYPLVFGIFLGLSILKFGNPVILDQRIAPPTTLYEAWIYSWPARWGYWLLAPLALIGAGLGVRMQARRAGARWFWILPAAWFGWQLVSATQTVDGQLTKAALWHFGGCLICYGAGALVLGNQRSLHWLLIGLLAAFSLCLVRAVNQRLFDFPQEQQLLLEGERTGWTNFAPDLLAQLKRDQAIVVANGIEVANPAVIAKYEKGRVHGTLMYPNALAGAVLLLWPVSIAVAFTRTRQFKALTRGLILLLTLFLGSAGLFWTGSKLGWLIAMGLLGMGLLRLPGPWRWKWALLTAALAAGSILFAVRFHSYFSAGAKSAEARFDYWQAALQTARAQPLFGSGPGTFQRPYARLKSADAEMARLAHNDYLEQFSDSGFIGGLGYLAWIVLALIAAGRRAWRSDEPLRFAVCLGVTGWFVQGLGEFSLYIPALAWTAFTLLGWLVSLAACSESPGSVHGVDADVT